MAHPYSAHNESAAGKAKAASMTKGYKKGGAVHKDEAEDKALFKKMFKKEEKGESKVEGKASGGRLDKFARGGHAKKHKGGNHVNIVIANPGNKGAPPPGGLPMPPPSAMPPPMGPPPGAGGPPDMPPGQPPMKRGGRAYASGGKVKMKAGSMTGEGRLDKIKAYGLKPIKG